MAQKPDAKGDPSNEGGPKPMFGYPKTFYHPIHGAVEVKDPNEEGALYPKHDYFATPEEADMHRTDREAGVVIHNNLDQKVEDHKKRHGGVVRNSVQAQQSIDEGNKGEPL